MVELLVVLAVVAILAGLLSAAMKNTQSRANQISCLNHLRQLQWGWFLYADDNDDQLPLNRTTSSADDRTFGRRNRLDSWVAGNPREDKGTDNIKLGTLFPYTKSAAIYRCRADHSQVLGGDIPRTRSYSMSIYMNGDGAGSNPRIKTTHSSIISPDKVFVFIEEHQESIWAGSFDVAPKERFSLASGSWTSTPSDRHNQGCNLSFADGHVEYWKWYWPKQHNLHNVLSVNKEELRDLRRLQDSVPKY